MGAKAYTFSKRTRDIVVALREGFIEEPLNLNISNSDEQTVQRCLILVREFPAIFRIAFVLGMHFFDHMTFLFGFGFKRYSKLDPERKRAYVQKWMKSPNYNIRNVVTGLRGFIMVPYFSHHDLWDYIGYHPKEHVQKKIALREKLIAEGKYADAPIEVASMFQSKHEAVPQDLKHNS